MEIKKIGIHGIAKMPVRLDNTFIPGIKQKLFLFDSVGVPNTGSLLDVLNNGNKPLFNEVSKMLDNKVIFDTHSTNAYETKRTGDGKFVVVPRQGMNVPVEFILEKPDEAREYGEMMRLTQDPNLSIELKNELSARITTNIWNALFHNEKTDEFFPLTSISNFPKFNKPKVEVQRILFENIPIPHPETPIEHILDFRANPDNSDRLLALRNLINEISHSGMSEIEIKQKIEYLTAVYKASLDKHKIRFGEGALDILTTVFTNPFALPGKIFNGIVSTYNSSVNLAKAEMLFPGREISYLYKAKQQFNPQ